MKLMAQVIDLRKKKPEDQQQNLEKHQTPAPSLVSYQEPASDAKSDDTSSQKPEMIYDVDRVTWEGPLYNHNPDLKAVVAVSLFLFGVALVAFFVQHNIVAAILFALLGIVLLIHARKDAEVGPFIIDTVGVSVHGKLHRYRDLESFWIEYSPKDRIQELSLHLKKKHLPYLRLPIYEQNPVQIRSLMIDFIPEIHHPDNVADVLARRLGI